MGCCIKNKEDNRDYPEGAQSCCGGRGKYCFCLPYNDPFMITSQALPIVVFFLSWIWWATFIISIVGWVMFQIPWCCRQNGGVQYGSATAAGVTALCHLGIGIYLLIVFSDKTWCEPFTFVSLKDYFPESDRCREEVWATIASVCAALWAGACGCLVYFVRSGRDAKWKKMHSGDSTNNIEEVELEAVGATTAAAAGPVVADAAVAVSEPVGNNKVDDF